MSCMVLTLVNLDARKRSTPRNRYNVLQLATLLGQPSDNTRPSRIEPKESAEIPQTNRDKLLPKRFCASAKTSLHNFLVSLLRPPDRRYASASANLSANTPASLPSSLTTHRSRNTNRLQLQRNHCQSNDRVSIRGYTVSIYDLYGAKATNLHWTTHFFAHEKVEYPSDRHDARQNTSQEDMADI